jgi:hypothetical protein
MQVVKVDTSDLSAMAAPYNPRTMPDREMSALRRSLRTWGLVEPVVVNTRTKRIVGGHQRVVAAGLEGIPQVPVTYVDLDEISERQLNLALNRIHGQWDEDLLAQLLNEIGSGGGDLTITGFDGSEIEAFLRQAIGGSDAVDDDVPPPPVDPITSHGDLIQLGPHSLLCGDATNAKIVERLFGTAKADGMWTDPPYGVEYEGKTAKKLKIQNDCADGLRMLLMGAFAAADAVLQPGAAIYIAHPDGALSIEFRRCIVEVGWRYAQTLIWVKDVLVLGHSDYHYRHEPIALAKKPGAGRQGRGSVGWYGDNSQTTVLEVKRPAASRVHPTMKPVELVSQCIRNSVKPGGGGIRPVPREWLHAHRVRAVRSLLLRHRARPRVLRRHRRAVGEIHRQEIEAAQWVPVMLGRPTAGGVNG